MRSYLYIYIYNGEKDEETRFECSLSEFFCIFGRAVKLMDARCNFFSPSNFISLQCLIGMDVKTMGILRYL